MHTTNSKSVIAQGRKREAPPRWALVSAAAATLLCGPVAAAELADVIKSTPCLYEYRYWFFDSRANKPPFVVPSEFTVAQCDEARRVHERVHGAPEEVSSTETEDEDRIRAQRQASEAASRAEARRGVQEHMQSVQREIAAETDIRQLSKRLREVDTTELCARFGEALRGETVYTATENDPTDAAPLFRAELKRRGLRFNEPLIKSAKIRVGASECTLHAAWGRPTDVNRTVSASAIRKQIVFDSLGTYVYTQNGVITAWQD